MAEPLRAAISLQGTLEIPGADLLPPHASGLPVLVVARQPAERLEQWLALHWSPLKRVFDEHGGLAFRGFRCADRTAFLASIECMGSRTLDILEESSRRVHLGDSIYTATEHPADFDIFPHHECSYSLAVPGRVFFFCADRAGQGGETLLADGYDICARIPLEIRTRFEERGWALHRRYGNGLGVSWQQAYTTDEPAEVDEYCRTHGIEARWDESILTTRQVRAPIQMHLTSGRAVWFNHICFFHRSALPADLLEILLAEGGGLPFDTTYGDDQPIDASVVEQLRAAYRACAVGFEWRSQDVLVLDNLRIAHGRRAYTGKRQLLFAAADPVRMRTYEPLPGEDFRGN
jgi:alpha-ketoglutarate-dependent taurine dioxygenase